jgi:hypothetical protein
MFGSYLELGFDHILDLKGYDHILFLIALCAAYSSSEWKKILILVTAFTIGHSITLALSSLDIVTIKAEVIEFIIPVTILITAILNLVIKPETSARWRFSYLLPLLFGFIHGMGFSNYFKALLGHEAEIILPLFAFNIGVELGQLVIVGIIMLLNFLIVGLGRIPQRYWNTGVSIIAALLAVYMIIGKI